MGKPVLGLVPEDQVTMLVSKHNNIVHELNRAHFSEIEQMQKEIQLLKKGLSILAGVQAVITKVTEAQKESGMAESIARILSI
jgi:hypothetical protein